MMSRAVLKMIDELREHAGSSEAWDVFSRSVYAADVKLLRITGRQPEAVLRQSIAAMMMSAACRCPLEGELSWSLAGDIVRDTCEHF